MKGRPTVLTLPAVPGVGVPGPCREGGVDPVTPRPFEGGLSVVVDGRPLDSSTMILLLYKYCLEVARWGGAVGERYRQRKM